MTKRGKPPCARYGVEFRGVSLHAEVDDLTEVSALLNGHAGKVQVFDRANQSILFDGSADDVRNGLGPNAVLRVDGIRPAAPPAKDRELPRLLIWKGLDIPLLVPGRSLDECPALDAIEAPVKANSELARLRASSAALEERVKELTASLHHQTNQVGLLASQLVDAEYRERRRLAALLHDQVQQLLVAAKIRIHQIGQTLAGTKDAPTAEEAKQLIQQSLNVSRSLSTEISSPLLHQCGLAAAIQWLGEHTRRQFQIEVVTLLDPKAEPVEESKKAFLYQAIRELTFNAVKHAKTDVIRIISSLTQSKMLRISIEDDGVGFDPSLLRNSRQSFDSSGLSGIAERMAALGGSMQIESQPLVGTSVHLELPLSR